MSASELQWNDEVRGNALVLSPKGRVDEATADAFKDHLVESMQSSPERAVIDLSGIDYMSSRGLRGFTLAQRAATQNGTTIVLAAPNDTLREILQISRYDTIFTVTETVEAALGN
ncbi:STAS domain-containing protein [Erythrobacter sp. SCSIO 43205]|nr:STAS domain-containing protein [Erythrobacter sp. SCSIO 43205]